MIAHWTLEEELRGTQDPTHFGRILQELGIGYIAAHSPQAKGRIERFWQTLQDRLVSELRLRGISTLEAANAFLPIFLADLNPRFARAPADAAAGLAPRAARSGRVLSCRYTRTVARDNTVRLGPRWVQLPRPPLLRRPARRGARGSRWPPARVHRGRLRRHAAGAGSDFVLKPRAPRAPSASRPAQRPHPTQNAPAPDRAAPQPAQDQRGPTQSRSPYPPQRGFPRPAARHPWRRAITKNAQALYPVKG